MNVLQASIIIALVGFTTGGLVSYDKPDAQGNAEVLPVTTQVDKSTWSPTYRAAREMGYEPAIAQHYANLCEMGKVQAGSDKLCIKPGMSKEQEIAHLNNVKTAAKILMSEQ